VGRWDNLGTKTYSFTITEYRRKDEAKEEFVEWDVVKQGNYRTAMGTRYNSATCFCESYEEFIPWKKISPEYQIAYMKGTRTLWITVPDKDDPILDELVSTGVDMIPYGIGTGINFMANRLKSLRVDITSWRESDTTWEVTSPFQYYRGYKYIQGEKYEQIYFREKVANATECSEYRMETSTPPPWQNIIDLTPPGAPKPPSWNDL
jgi:hypothetical protein